MDRARANHLGPCDGVFIGRFWQHARPPGRGARRVSSPAPEPGTTAAQKCRQAARPPWNRLRGVFVTGNEVESALERRNLRFGSLYCRFLMRNGSPFSREWRTLLPGTLDESPERSILPPSD